MERAPLEPGDVVQISPEVEDSFFGGCLGVVKEVYDWGALVMIAAPQERGQHREAFDRVPWEDMEFVGRVTWATADLVPRIDPVDHEHWQAWAGAFLQGRTEREARSSGQGDEQCNP